MDKNMRKPSLRFKGFTDDWEQYKLGDLGFFKSNGVDKLSKPNEIPVNLLNYMDVYNRREVSNKNANELMQVTAKPSQLIENSVMKNDVFFTPTSETPQDIGRVYVIEETLNNTVYSYHLMRFRPNQGTYYPNFPNYSLMTENVRKQFFLAAKGVQRYVISKADFESIVDTIPEYKEQAKIGEFFRSIDSLITLHQRKYDKLVNIKKSLLEKMFPQNGESIPRLRFKGFTDAWEQYKLGDLGFFKSNGVDKLSKPNEIPVNLLNYMDVYNRREVSNKNANELMQVTAKPSQLIENSVMKNDVFFTPTSETPQDIGRVYVIEETLNNTVYSYHLMRFRPNQGTYYPNFPNYSLMTENVRKQFFLAAKGVQRYVISKADFESIVDTIPEYKEQAKIGEFFRSIDSLITLHQRKYEKLQNIKKALLQKMFV